EPRAHRGRRRRRPRPPSRRPALGRRHELHAGAGGHARAARGARGHAPQARLRVAGIELRREPPGEEPGASLLAAYSAHVASKYDDWDTTRGSTATDEELTPPDGCLLVAYSGGEPVGCGALKRLDADTCEIKRMYVVPQARGQGVGK